MAGRTPAKPGEKQSVQIKAYVKPASAELLDDVAARMNITRPELIRRALKAYTESKVRMPPVDPEQYAAWQATR